MLFVKKIEGFTGNYNIENFSSQNEKQYLILTNDKLEPIGFSSETENFPEKLIYPKTLSVNNFKELDDTYKTFEYDFTATDYKYLTRLYLVYRGDQGNKDIQIESIQLNGKYIANTRTVYRLIFGAQGEFMDKERPNKLYWGGTYILNVYSEIEKNNTFKIKLRCDESGQTCKFSVCLLLEKKIRRNFFYNNDEELEEYTKKEIISLGKDIHLCSSGDTTYIPTEFKKFKPIGYRQFKISKDFNNNKKMFKTFIK